ncbi:MAG: Gfo/Idh/MocA family oxidoreductase [Planctomycetota bacterium]
MSSQSSSVKRRNFIRDSGLLIAGGAIGGASHGAPASQPVDVQPLRVAFVGCGRRARELSSVLLGQTKLNSHCDDSLDPNEMGSREVVVTALADFFGSQVQSFYRSLKGRFKSSIGDGCRRVSGADCLEGVLQDDVDLVFVTTPPVCRPEFFSKLVSAGKHVFLEKPLAASTSGVEQIRDVSKNAQQSGLTIHVGFQRRYDPSYRQAIEKIREGLIGKPLYARTFCRVNELRELPPRRKESEIEFQLRNWKHFRWTGGDFLLEQHVAGLDLIRQTIGEQPNVVHGFGGWNRHAGDTVGDVYDHHSVDFEYPSGFVCSSNCRRKESWNQSGEFIHGAEGTAELSAGRITDSHGEILWKGLPPSPKAATHLQLSALLNSIRTGAAENQIDGAAESTLLALAAQEATLTGKRIRIS